MTWHLYFCSVYWGWVYCRV